MDWRPIETAPEDGRIIVFTPDYPEHDPMRYRIIDAQFLRHLNEVTHWTPLEPPATPIYCSNRKCQYNQCETEEVTSCICTCPDPPNFDVAYCDSDPSNVACLNFKEISDDKM